MLPAEPIVRAAKRWLRLLRTSTVSQAAALIRADAAYTDLTQTQYSSALEWLGVVSFLSDRTGSLELESSIKHLPDLETAQLLFERAIEVGAPAWLPDADVLVPDADAVPQDAAMVAATLELSDSMTLSAIRHVHGRVDASSRQSLGADGERGLIQVLEQQWPGSTVHVAATDDGFGYDVLFRHSGIEWHLEVKTTLRRGRLVVYISRHEYEVSVRDPHWRLIVVGLNEQRRVRAIATVSHQAVFGRTPQDVCLEARWQSTSYQLGANDLHAGLNFVGASMEVLQRGLCSEVGEPMESRSSFGWMPY